MRRSVEYPFIQINNTGFNAISFRDIGNTYPYIKSDYSHIVTVTDYNGVWKKGLLSGDTWKNDPDISYAFRHIVERTEEFYLITARTETKRCSIFPFISSDFIEEIHSDVKDINPDCKLTVVCGLEKIFNGNTLREIIMRKIEQKHNVGIFGSSLRDRVLAGRIYNESGDKRQNLTIFDTGHLIV